MPGKTPTPLDSDDLSDFPVFGGNIELISQFKETKQSLVAEQNEYLKQHPEIQRISSDFLKTLLHRKPEDVYQFTVDYFAMFLSPQQLEKLKRERQAVSPKTTEAAAVDEDRNKRQRVSEEVGKDVAHQEATADGGVKAAEVTVTELADVQEVADVVEKGAEVTDDTGVAETETIKEEVEPDGEANVVSEQGEVTKEESVKEESMKEDSITEEPAEVEEEPAEATEATEEEIKE